MVASYKNGIPLLSLPQTLRDAIAVTRRLGHRSLWVDALCILQDDEKFKDLELAKMGHIYTNSLLTIQAAVPKSVRDGFLALRQPQIAAPVRLLFARGDAGGGRPPSYVQARLRYEPEGMTLSTSSRAWIFQETVLPVRLLVYAEQQAMLACRERVCREDSASDMGISSINPQYYRRIRPDLQSDGQSAARVRELALTSWYFLLSTFYSKRIQSVSDDRLYALSAYAGEAHHAIGGEYHAGVWAVDLLYSLQWRRNGLIPLQRAGTYRAPSWSWAAYDGQIQYESKQRVLERNEKHGVQDPDPSYQPRTLEVWTTKAGFSQFGPCRDGQIVLETLVGWAVPSPAAQRIRNSSHRLQTLDSAEDICCGWFDTETTPARPVLCASLTGIAGLMLVEGGSRDGRKAFERFGRLRLTLECPGAKFAAWRGACRMETIIIV